MKFYEKYYASNYEELIAHYPRFYREVFEMVEILKAHGRIADGIEDNIEQAYLNGFIDYADEATIAKMEKFLGIGPNKNRTFEERKRLVKSYFVGFGKLSASLICEMVYSYTNARVSCRFEPFDEEKNNALYVDLEQDAGNIVYMSAIEALLSFKIPAHIQYFIYARIERTAEIICCTGVNQFQVYRPAPIIDGYMTTSEVDNNIYFRTAIIQEIYPVAVR